MSAAQGQTLGELLKQGYKTVEPQIDTDKIGGNILVISPKGENFTISPSGDVTPVINKT